MAHSSTVENYLKEVYLGVSRLPAGQLLLPMGQLATALRVAPGTATTMVKALSESGLVEYEPYNGVRLTAAGTKLAATVLRRHRLVELFLVQVMGMRWDEVHDDAEHLEHVVSDRLLDRIDEMLGHPETDPHGDPIPGKEGTILERHFETLLTCAVGVPVVVARVSDQDPVFLRFVERHGLKPGEAGARGSARRGSRRRAPARPGRPDHHHRRARRLEAARGRGRPLTVRRSGPRGAEPRR